MKKTILFLIVLIALSFSCKKEAPPINTDDFLYNKLQYVCDSMIDNSHVTGMVAAVWAPDREIDFVYSTGIADISINKPMEKNFHFRIGSNTKTATITRFLQLVDSGYVSLQDTLNKFYPNFPKSSQITLEMLTDMTSGIGSYTQNDSFQLAMFNDPTRIWSMDELIDYSRTDPFHFEPGNGFDYCNTNTQLIGRIIEIITNDNLENQIQRHIIEPLGLKNTYYLRSGTTMPAPHPKGYYDGAYKSGYPEFSEKYDISWAQAAGSMVSTVYDLRTYVEALNDGTFLSDSLQNIRMSKKLFFREGVYYSIGAAWFNDYYGHDGALPGFTSTMVHSNTKNCTIIVWFNCNLDNDGVHTDHIFNRFDEIIFD
ncbi:MAG: hypothetical protein DRI84_07985 [Bacteroidetes bacterium]|nr:MAG: hypothetical protein DRI84_07985 [Bacteroidota bacterium]